MHLLIKKLNEGNRGGEKTTIVAPFRMDINVCVYLILSLSFY